MKALFAALLVFACAAIHGQPVYVSKSSTVSFFAGTSVEDIDATNTKAMSFFNTDTGEVVISMPNKEFHFRRALMEEHFNENYMESDKYPKSEFKGKINDAGKVKFSEAGPFQVTVTGQLTIHGVSQERTIDVAIKKENNRLVAETKFQVLLDDHKIERPKILWEKIAERVDVTATFTYEPYKK